MDALTLYQPWASAIAEGDKANETRSWRPPRQVIGRRLAIHAARRMPRISGAEAPKLHRAITASRLRQVHGEDWRRALPRGAVVAITRLAGCFLITGRDGGRLRLEGYGEDPGDVAPDPWGDFRTGRWVWVFRDTVRLAVPAPALGGRQIWQWTEPEQEEERR